MPDDPAVKYAGEASAPTGHTARDLVRYAFCEEMRRLYHAARGLGDEDLNAAMPNGANSVGWILAHINGLIRFMAEPIAPGQMAAAGLDESRCVEQREGGPWYCAGPLAETRERLAERFLAILDRTPDDRWLARVPEMPPPAWADWPVLMRVGRPLVDLATHVGQVSYLRRVLGKR